MTSTVATAFRGATGNSTSSPRCRHLWVRLPPILLRRDFIYPRENTESSGRYGKPADGFMLLHRVLKFGFFGITAVACTAWRCFSLFVIIRSEATEILFAIRWKYSRSTLSESALQVPQHLPLSSQSVANLHGPGGPHLLETMAHAFRSAGPVVASPHT